MTAFHRRGAGAASLFFALCLLAVAPPAEAGPRNQGPADASDVDASPEPARAAGDVLLSARVESEGQLISGKGVKWVKWPADVGDPGSYAVIFERDVSTCVYSASSRTFLMDIEVQPLFGNKKGVYVFVHPDEVDGDLIGEAGAFDLIVLCQ